MPANEVLFEEVKTSQDTFKISPLAVEPINDIAILGGLDGQTFPKEETVGFERFCDQTKPVPLCTSEFKLQHEFRIHIYTHKKKWILGHAVQWSFWRSQLVFIEAEEQIECGTSGSPIINDSGELVAIVSFVSKAHANAKCSGLAPRPHLTMPVWLYHEILAES